MYAFIYVCILKMCTTYTHIKKLSINYLMRLKYM